MTSWNAITPFSRFIGQSDWSGSGDEPGAVPGLDDAVRARPLPEPAQPHPLGFLDVRGDASGVTGTHRDDDSGDDASLDDGIHTEVSFRPVERDEPTSEQVTFEDPVVDVSTDVEAEEQTAPELSHVEAEETASELSHVEAEEETASAAAPASQEADEVVVLSEHPVVEKPRRRARGLQRRRSDAGGRGRVVGLKIGASQLAAAVVSHSGGRPELLELARTPLEPGIVVDGEVRDGEALRQALREFFSEFSLPTRDVRIGLASSRIGVRTFDIVGVEDESRLDNAVRFKAHEVLPVSVHESVLDYRILGERFSETGESIRRIFLVVAPNDQVRPYVEVAREAGLRLRGIDLEALALLRAFVEPHQPGIPVSDDRAPVVVAIGHEASTLLVAGGGTCEFTRVFDWGGSTLQDAIAQELGVHTDEAGTILRHLSLATPGLELAGLDTESRARALEAVRLRLTPFARELVSSLQFYQTQPDSLGIGEILITGGGSHLEGLAEALNQMIGVGVRVGDPLSRVLVRRSFDPEIESAIGSMAVPIGLAIDDSATRSVNLLPSDARKAQRRRPSLAAVALPAAAAVPAAAIAFFFLQASGEVNDRQQALAVKQQELAALPVPKRPQLDPNLKGEQANRALAVAEVLGQRLAWDGVLRDLSRVLPGDVWLTQLSAKVSQPLSVATGAAAPAPAAVPALTATGVTIAGYTYSHSDVAELIARLGTVPSLKNVQLQSSARAAVGQKPVVQFTILADLREAGGAR